MPLLWVIFLVTPLIEMYVLIKVGGIIGAAATIGLVVLTATIGLAMLRHEGLATLRRVQERAERGEMPADELLGGLLLLVGGALLLTPGFITDAFGFALLFRPTRLAIARAMGGRVVHFMRTGPGTDGGRGPGGRGPGGRGPGGPGSARPHAPPGQDPFGRRPPGPRSSGDGPVIIEGEYTRRD